MNTIIFESFSGIVAVVLVFELMSGERRLKYAIARFGGKKTEGITDDVRDSLARQYMRQQAIAFGLVVAAIILGLLLSSSLVFRLIFTRTSNLADVGRAFVLAGNLFLGRYAYRSYQDASARAEKLVI